MGERAGAKGWGRLQRLGTAGAQSLCWQLRGEPLRHLELSPSDSSQTSGLQNWEEMSCVITKLVAACYSSPRKLTHTPSRLSPEASFTQEFGSKVFTKENQCEQGCHVPRVGPCAPWLRGPLSCMHDQQCRHLPLLTISARLGGSCPPWVGAFCFLCDLFYFCLRLLLAPRGLPR